MSAKYDSGLHDADDMASAYTDGFSAAKQMLTLTFTTVCPICMEPLVVTQYTLRSLPLFVHSELRICQEITVLIEMSRGEMV